MTRVDRQGRWSSRLNRYSSLSRLLTFTFSRQPLFSTAADNNFLPCSNLSAIELSREIGVSVIIRGGETTEELRCVPQQNMRHVKHAAERASPVFTTLSQYIPVYVVTYKHKKQSKWGDIYNVWRRCFPQTFYYYYSINIHLLKKPARMNWIGYWSALFSVATLLAANQKSQSNLGTSRVAAAAFSLYVT